MKEKIISTVLKTIAALISWPLLCRDWLDENEYPHEQLPDYIRVSFYILQAVWWIILIGALFGLFVFLLMPR